MASLATKVGAMRRGFRELGPLRPVAVYVAVVPTIGAVLLLSWLPGIAGVLPPDGIVVAVGLAASVTVATAGAFVLPSAVAFAAGYLVGIEQGFWLVLSGAALGCLIAHRSLWPRLGTTLLAFMQERPRAAAVRRFCAGGTSAGVFGVARLRWAAVLPLPVVNLLCAVAGVSWRAVLLGNLMGAVPTVLLAAAVGDGWRTWRATGELPGPRSITIGVAALVATGLLLRASRRLWRATLALEQQPGP